MGHVVRGAALLLCLSCAPPSRPAQELPPPNRVTQAPAVQDARLPYGARPGGVRVIYDNDQTLDAYTDELLMAMASAGKILLAGMITTRTVNGIGYDKFDVLVRERARMVDLARRSGFKNLPDPVEGPRISLARPASGTIEDTKPVDTPGSRLIVREAAKCSPSDPLVIVCGGQLTSVADAYLLDRSVAGRVVVAALLGGERDMADFNGLQDPWAAYIVLEKLIYVQFPANQAAPRAPKEWLRNALPDKPLRQWMIQKVHPLFPDRYPGEHDYDGQPALPLLTDMYALEAEPIRFGGWATRSFGGQNVQVPLLERAASGATSRAYRVVKAEPEAGTRAWQAAMADPTAWGAAAPANR